MSSDEVNWRSTWPSFTARGQGSPRLCSLEHSLGTTRRIAGWPEQCRRRRVPCSISRAGQARCRASWRSRGVRSLVWICLNMSWRWLLNGDQGHGSGLMGCSFPFRDECIDVVTSSMGLVVVQPLTRVVEEVARVLRPGGVLAAIAPAIRPLGPRDLRVLTRINGRLRTKPQFPGPVELTGFAKILTLHGMRAVEDARERYRFSIRSRADAELVMSALYLPNTRWSRVESAIEYLEDRVKKQDVVDVAIPMRRLVAIK